MTVNHKPPAPDAITEPAGRFWQPPEKRDQISEEGRKWLEENAEAIRGWHEYIEKHGLPLAKYRRF